jgi:hypothetical protein
MKRILKGLVLILILPTAPILDVVFPASHPRIEIWKGLWGKHVLGEK